MTSRNYHQRLCMSVCPSVYLIVRLSICLSICLLSPCLCFFVPFVVCLIVRLSVCLSVCLSFLCFFCGAILWNSLPNAISLLSCFLSLFDFVSLYLNALLGPYLQYTYLVSIEFILSSPFTDITICRNIQISSRAFI